MSNQPPSGPRDPHSMIDARVTLAEQDLAEADEIDLASADASDLVVLVVKLKGAVADLVRLYREHPPRLTCGND